MFWPVALRYEFRGEQRPEAFIRAGPLHAVDPGLDEAAIVADVRERLTTVVDLLRDEVNENRLDNYRPLLNGRPGINRVWDSVAGIWRQSISRPPGMSRQPDLPSDSRAPDSQL